MATKGALEACASSSSHPAEDPEMAASECQASLRGVRSGEIHATPLPPETLGGLTTGAPPWRRLALPESLQWIPANWKWSKIKLVLRCALAAWISAVLFVIPALENIMGQASFLILIAAFLSPPADPFIAVLERELLILFFASLSWAWSCLGIKLADLARKNRDPSVTFTQAITGAYIEAVPTVILGIFIFLGTAFLLYVRAKQGPGPYLFATVLACICLDICITTAALFPWPFYLVGRTIIVPLAFHSAVSLFCSLTIFPSSVSAQFTTRLQTVLTPLDQFLSLHIQLLNTRADGPEFVSLASSVLGLVYQCESNLVPLAASARLLPSDLIFCRFSPGDFNIFQQLARRIAGRADGMVMYFALIDPTRERFSASPMGSAQGTPASTPSHSRHPSRTGSSIDLKQESQNIDEQRSSSHRGTRRSHASVNWLHHALHHGSQIPVPRPHQPEYAVGVFESHKYLNLEAIRNHPESQLHTNLTNLLLRDSCEDLVKSCRDGVKEMQGWFGGLRQARLKVWVNRKDRDIRRLKTIKCLEATRDKLSSCLERFREENRHVVLEPYIAAFEGRADHGTPSHHHLFHCYVYQYHLMQFASIVLEMLDESIRLEKYRRKPRLWIPVKRLFKWNMWEIAENIDHDDDEDPDVIQGLEPSVAEDLGLPRRRDPDALPPRNRVEWLMSRVYYAIAGLAGGNVLFALKAGVLTVLLCLPSFLASSAAFAYRGRFVWGIFMGQVTLARFRGDTAFALIARVFSTFLGCVVGAAMWYTSCGSSSGNAFGLAAVCAICFPFFFYARLYLPGPPMTNIVFFVTAILVLGYSYMDAKSAIPASPPFGIDLAWRRFVLVTAGVTAAFIFSFLPPSTTIRLYQRKILSTASAETGAIYCSVVSYASMKRERDIQEIVTGLIAVRSKLKRSAIMRTNVVYEFSLRGRWPVKRYQKIQELQMQISYCLSHLLSVLTHLEPAWTQAFLRRTRLDDPDFQGDVLAVINMVSSALQTGTPLPQITPCPLLDRFMLRFHGLNVIHKESDEDYGLPRTLTVETLKNEQYLIFCVGVSTAFALMTRLDNLMLATKEIVGEQYHIHGIGVRHAPPAPKSGSIHITKLQKDD
ncbi:hypothetical protein BDN72DRAFT_880366 [Pluteus cervinus]|uniref:Uncharacterized protein n=1 Tax=Pluteus cervinus TaxID=181527 RepID=A0ACD3AKS1_9AGAR|nr:hypothetical protein BDN72DRAFT_880366 [Pluteus cervinus]